jgi:hypothetical protein
MHLPVAACIGLALPVTRPVRVIYEDQYGGMWDSTRSAEPIELERADVVPPGIVPAPWGVAVARVGSALVAYAAAVFGVWQSARAASVRAVLESGGLLRLVIIVGVFFVGPWLLGLLSPAGVAPAVPLPGAGEPVSADALRQAVADPVRLAVVVAAAAALGGLVLGRLTTAALGRSDREGLLLVAAQPAGRGFGRRRRRGTTGRGDE